jgi:hypothetical protein
VENLFNIVKNDDTDKSRGERKLKEGTQTSKGQIRGK